MSLPTAPLYTNEAGQPIYWIGTVHKHPRAPGAMPEALIIHDTGGTDSRLYGRQNDRKVSYHYLVGVWPDTNGPRIYKYASESKDVCWHAGPGRLGGIRTQNLNDASIAIELELASINTAATQEAARLARCILDYWNALGVQLVMLPHHIVQSDKTDPRTNWGQWCGMVYR